MSVRKRIVSIAILFCIIFCEIGITASALTDSEKEHIEELIGTYYGTYTANQGITGLTLFIFRTEDLLQDDETMISLADIATYSCKDSEGNPKQYFTEDSIRKVVLNHTEDYIAFFNYYPKLNAEGVGPNPNVEQGLFTMTVSYNESANNFNFIKDQWIQHDTYEMVDLKNVTFDKDILSGDVCYEYDSFFGTEYGKMGDVKVILSNSQVDYRIDFENSSVSLAVDEKQTINAIVKDENNSISKQQARIKWYSSNDSIVSVDGENWGDSGFEYASATLTGLSNGKAYVYAEIDNGRTVVCTVIVSDNEVSVPLEINLSNKLVTRIISQTEGNITTYQFKPNYIISAEIKNTNIKPSTNVQVILAMPDGMSLYGDGTLNAIIDKIDSASSESLTWNVVVEGDYKSSRSYKYNVIVKSDQSVISTKYETIFVEPFEGNDNRLTYPDDIWQFTNSNEFFDKKYYINSKYYDSLVKSVSNVERERIDNNLRKSDWKGSCHGMSSIVTLMKVKHLNTNDYQNYGNTLSKLSPVNKSDEIYSLVTYYHMLQLLDVQREAEVQNLSINERQRLIDLVNAVEKVKIGGTPVLLSIWYMIRDFDIHSIETDYFDGHAIVAYDVEYGTYSIKRLVGGTNASFDKRILIYDPNNNKKPIYMYINSDFTQWQVEGYCQNRTSSDGLYWYKSEGYFAFLDDVNVIDAVNANDAIDSYHPRLISYRNMNLIINEINGNFNKKQYVVNGINIFKYQNRKLIPYAEMLLGNSKSSGFGYILADDTEEVVVELQDKAAEIDFQYETNEVTMATKAESGELVTFVDNGSVSMKCDGSYKLSAIYNEGYYSSLWYYYSIEGENSPNIGLSQDEDGYVIVNGDNLDNIKITVKNLEEEQTKIISTESKSLLLKDDGNKLTVYIDSDGNGTFDMKLDNQDSATVSNGQPQSFIDIIKQCGIIFMIFLLIIFAVAVIVIVAKNII